jgi:LysR family transcriptional regulator, cys regulon transcriptional activator
VRLHLHQGTSEQIAEMAALDRIDFAIATGSQSLFDGYALLPCYRWHRDVVVPKGHPLARQESPTLRQLAAHPIVTYVFGFSGPSSLMEIFAKEGLVPDVALTARDADVIKTYVRLGLGIGILAGVAVDPEADDDLVRIDTSHLFPAHTTWIGFRRGGLLRKYQLDFVRQFAPHLTRRVIEEAAGAASQADVDELVKGLELPVR